MAEKTQKEYVFNGSFNWSTLEEGSNFTPSDIYIIEDINDFNKTIVMDFIENEGVNEFIGLWKKEKLKKHKQVILYGNYLEEASALKCIVGYIQDIIVSNVDTEDRIYKKIRISIVEITDNILNQGPKEKKFYKNTTANEVYKDIYSSLNNSSLVNIECVEEGDSLNIPLLINPYWSQGKLLKYVSMNYVYNGPGKTINTYEHVNGKWSKINMGYYPLQYLLNGKYGDGGILKIEPDNTNLNGIRLDYRIHGPSRMDRFYKDFKSQGVYLFNDKKGVNPNELSMDDFNSDTTIGPTFDDNDERGYINPFFTTVSKNSEVTSKLGSFLNESDVERGESSCNVKIDCEPKPIVQHKILNRFSQYNHQNFILECIVAPSKNLSIGKVYYIKIPSRNQENSVGIEDKTLSGKWLLSRIEHKIYKNGDRYEYLPKCYFVRTGLENAPSNDPNMKKSEDKSLQEKKPKKNITVRDKFNSMSSKAKKTLSDAKSKVKDVTSGVTNAVSNVASNVTSSIGSATSAIGGAVGGIFSSKVVKSGASGSIGGVSKTVINGVNTTIKSPSSKLYNGSSALSKVNNSSNIVTRAKDYNKLEIVQPKGDVKVINGSMNIDGKDTNINGLVKGKSEDGNFNGKILANYNDGNDKIIEGNISGTYNKETSVFEGQVKGNEINDYSDDEIRQSISNDEDLTNEWFKK